MASLSLAVLVSLQVWAPALLRAQMALGTAVGPAGVPPPPSSGDALAPALRRWYELVWRINSWRLFKNDPVVLGSLAAADRPALASIDLGWLEQFKGRVVAARSGDLTSLEQEMEAWEIALPESIRNKKILFASIQDLKTYFLGKSGGGPVYSRLMRELHGIKMDIMSQASLDGVELASRMDTLHSWEQGAQGKLGLNLSDGQRDELTLLFRKNQGLRGDAALQLQGSLNRFRSRILEAREESQAQIFNKMYDKIALLGVEIAGVSAPAVGAAQPSMDATDLQGVRFFEVPAAVSPGQGGASLADWVREWALSKWRSGDVHKRAYRDFEQFRSVAYMIADKALGYGIHPLLAFGVVGAESSWNPFDISKAGAVGLCQVMPFRRSVARLMNPTINAEYGLGELKTDLKYYAGRHGVDVDVFRSSPSAWSDAAKKVATLALRAYNCGLYGLNRVLAGKKRMPDETLHYPYRVFHEMERLLA